MIEKDMTTAEKLAWNAAIDAAMKTVFYLEGLAKGIYEPKEAAEKAAERLAAYTNCRLQIEVQKVRLP
jgi:hypothetical protein